MTLPRRKLKAINVYGDMPLRISQVHGTDVSSSRFDDLDKIAIDYVNKAPSELKGVDLGSGLGMPSVAMALLGANLRLFDTLDLSTHFKRISEALGIDRLQFVHEDLRALQSTSLSPHIDFIYSQRFIHYLTYDDARRLLKTCVSRLQPRGRVFLSASGLGSELGSGYVDTNKPVQARFAELSPTMAKKHDIHAAVCLYTEADLIQLAQTLGLQTEKVWSSPFGNVKGIFSK